MAPEVLARKAYDERCDLWSCGVLLYYLLAGCPPFYGHNREEIIEAALKGKVEFSQPKWATVSQNARQLIQRLLAYDPANRISAADALTHCWFLRYIPQPQINPLDLQRVLINLKSFEAHNAMQEAGLSYIASQHMKEEEEGKLRECFSLLDSDKDGRVSTKDLAKNMTQLYHDFQAQREAEHIVSSYQFCGGESISYNGMSFDHQQSSSSRTSTSVPLSDSIGFDRPSNCSTMFVTQVRNRRARKAISASRIFDVSSTLAATKLLSK
jgi:calcium-dependent protein kinase